jgi:hypothetical protein
MRVFKSIVIAEFIILFVISPALAKGIKDILHPLKVPPPRGSNCTSGGLPSCKRILPPALLTEDQVKTIVRWHNENIEAAKARLSK